MSLKIDIPLPELKATGIVRGPDGKPKIDDPSTLLPEQVEALTTEERAALGDALPKYGLA